MKDADKFITSPKHQEHPSITEFVTIILLGENQGYRMKSYGPMPLLNIENKTLIEKQVDAIKAVFTNFEIILCCGFEAVKTTEFIRSRFPKVNIRVVENQIHNHSNCCESLRLCINNTTNNKIIVCSGELLLTPKQLTKIDLNVSSVMIQENNPIYNLEVGVITSGENLSNMSVGIKTSNWCEILYISNISMAQQFHAIVSTIDYKNRLMFEAINEFIKHNKLAIIDSSDCPIVKISNIKTLRRISKS